MKMQDKSACMTVVLAILSFLLVPALRAQETDPPDRVARIAYLNGDVSLLYSGAQSWSAAPPNYPMISGDRLYTGDGARAAIQSGSTDVRMWNDSDVTLTNLTDTYEQLGLAQGNIRVRVFGLNPGGTVEVDTPNGAVIIQQPGDYSVNAYPNQGGSLVAVNAGSVQLTGPGVNQLVDQGQAVQLYGANPIEVGLVDMPGFDDLDRWSIERDHHILNSVSARYVSRQMPGYDDLDDYGSWTPSSEYGPVWYPTGVASGWAPYTYGHWAYVAPWGWTWIDDAPWGYAPFHYGRWAVIGGRWGWVPGPPTVAPAYSPALVAFVGGGPHFSIGLNFGGGGGVAAWFPIGVGEPYVPWYHCSSNYVRNVNVTNVNTTTIHNTTIINNYNTFITNTKTVNNVTQINTTNIQYVNRNNVVAVPANSMSTGARVQQAQVHLDPQQKQQLARAPVTVGQPPAAAPAHPLLQARANVSRPVQAPQLLTPHGRAAATPAANTAHFSPASLPKPQPSATIRPATHTVVPNVKPASASNTAAHPATPTPANRLGTPATTTANKPNTPPAPANRPAQPSTATSHPAPVNQPQPRPLAETKPNTEPAAKPPSEARPNEQPAKPPTEAHPNTPPARPQTEAHPGEQQARPQQQQEPKPNATAPKPPPPQHQAAPKPEAKPEPKPKPEGKPEEKKPEEKPDL
jgi:hypothetical protein